MFGLGLSTNYAALVSGSSNYLRHMIRFIRASHDMILLGVSLFWLQKLWCLTLGLFERRECSDAKNSGQSEEWSLFSCGCGG